MNQWIATPVAKPAANIFALTSFVASYQSCRDSGPVVKRFGLPKQWTVSDYLDANYVRK